ncbi:MAG: Ig-like domain-containing protein, partial [Actinomycetes bacterium]
VTVAPANAKPVAGTPTVGTPNPSTGAVTGTVSATDADKDTLTYGAPATTAKGAVVINAGTGAFTYTPTATARHAAARIGAVTADKADTFTVTATDGYGGSVAIPVNVTVDPANAKPVAAGTPAVGTPNASTGVVTGSVSATDPDGDNLTYSGSTTTPKGSVTVAANGSFTYTPTATARLNAGRTGATAADKSDNFTVTVTDGYGGAASIPVKVVVRSLLKTGDIVRQPGGTWRAIYLPNMTTSGNWLGVIPDNGGIWFNDSDVSGWLDVPPPTGTETVGAGPYSAGDIKVPPGAVEGSVTWFAVKTAPPLSNIRSWMACGLNSACNAVSDNEVILGSPIAQWVDLKISD